jgi:hypothetical protein
MLKQVVSVSGEHRIAIERDLELTDWQFFDYIETIPPRFLFVSRVLDGFHVDESDLFPPVVKTLLVVIPSGDGRMTAAATIILSVDQLILREHRASCDLVVRSRFDGGRNVFTNGCKIFSLQCRVFLEYVVVGHAVEYQRPVNGPHLDLRVTDTCDWWLARLDGDAFSRHGWLRVGQCCYPFSFFFVIA